MSPPKSARWGAVRSLLCLAPIFVAVPLLSYRALYALPEPIVDLVDPSTGLPQLSEARILHHAQYLSEEVGFRTVGTREHANGDVYVLSQAEAYREQCEELVRAQPGRKLECEVWHQVGSGSHRFDILGKRLYKTYVNLTNIVVRLSDGTDAGKEHAVLVNAHVDSTLPSPGAADDALSVGVMFECMRVLINTPTWQPSHSIIFLFNNAEESLQDGSHLFSTQHPIRDTVRAVINLEAAGSTGPELLFQATSEQMIQAYSHVPRPHGTIVANEVFTSGIIMSDTDFRQFELYLNVTGLDMAVVGDSYLYHMRKDLVENIERGVAQHMADNTLALLQHLSSPDSPLPTLTEGYTRPTTVFFQFFAHFFAYSYSTAKMIYGTFLALTVVLVWQTYVDPAPALKAGTSFVGEQLKGVIAVASAILGGLLGANLVAFVMQRVLGKGMSWFANEFSTLALYGPATLTGVLASQLFVGRVREHTTFTSLLLLQAFGAFAVQMAGIGSAAIFFLSAVSLWLGLALNTLLTRPGEDMSLWSYAIGQFSALSVGTQTICQTLDVFVPLTGRMGAEAPAEHIIAIIIAVTGSFTLPLAIPFVHRFNRRLLLRGVILSALTTVAMIVVFSFRSPFDPMHQKRLFILHMENITSEEQHLHIAAADSAPGFDLLARDIAAEFSIAGVIPSVSAIDDWNGDWDAIYPLSHFLTTYKFDLPVKPEHLEPIDHDFTVTATNDVIDAAAGTRSLTIVVKHPGIIWTTIAFDAHVLKWTLDNNPPDHYARHHIKEASFYLENTWTVDLVMKLPPSPSEASHGLKVNFVGIHEKAMWPGKKAEKEHGGRAMKLFEEFDSWLEQKTGGNVDATLLGCVGGVTTI